MGIKNGFLVIFIWLGTSLAMGQELPFVTEYDAETYGSWRQNWAITQDTSGYIFIGNGTGIIRYDGIEWLATELPKNQIVRSLLHHNGTVYVGGEAEFGYLKPDSINHFQFYNIVPPEEWGSDFSTIWAITPMKETIYFGSQEVLFGFQDGKLDTLTHQQRFGGNIFKMGPDIILTVKGVGLARVGNNALDPVSGSQAYGNDRLFVVLPFLSQHLLISRNQGFMLFDGKTFEKFETEAEEYIEKHKVYRGVVLNENEIAVATLTGGIVIINSRGKVRQILTEESGLPTNVIYGLHVDKEQTLWAATDEGLAKILVSNPLRKIDERSGFTGIPTVMTQLDATLYIGSTEGLFRITKAGSVIKISENISRVLDGFKQNNAFIVSTPEGVFRLVEDDISKLSNEIYRYITPASEVGFYYAGNGSSIERLKLMDDGFLENKSDFNISAHLDGLLVSDSTIWVPTSTGQILRYNTAEKLTGNYQLSEKDLAIEKIGYLDQKIVVGTEEGLWKFNAGEDTFEKWTDFEDEELLQNQVNNFAQCFENEIWFRNNRRIKRARRTEDGWEIYDNRYNLIDEGKTITDILCGIGREMWFGGSTGIYRLENPDWTYAHNFKTNITDVLINRDSVIYRGYGEPDTIPQLRYNQNEIRFSYAAASFIKPEQNNYRMRLRGIDKEWSSWTTETEKDYTFIDAGTYTFEVQGKNVYNKLGTVAKYKFTVLPPWYQTWWAYIIYTVLIIGFGYSAYKIRINQILREYKIRNSIADDLHDEISATLTSISFFAEAAKQKSSEKSSDYINLIAESAGDTKEKITDIVWAINPEHDDWHSFLAKCKRYASDLLESKNIRYEFEIEHKLSGKMDMKMRQQLWMIFKEIITNIVRHSEATKVVIRFLGTSKGLKIVVQDNGKGFEPNKNERGNGVRNIHKRAEEINARVELKSNEKLGTRWVCNIPV